MKKKYQVIIGLLLSMTALLTLSCGDVMTDNQAVVQEQGFEIPSATRAVGDTLARYTKDTIVVTAVQTGTNQVTINFVSPVKKTLNYTIQFLMDGILYLNQTETLYLQPGGVQSRVFYYRNGYILQFTVNSIS